MAELTIHGIDERAITALLSRLARMHASKKHGSQMRSFEDLLVVFDQAQQGKPLYDPEETRDAIQELCSTRGRARYYQSVHTYAKEVIDQLRNEHGPHVDAEYLDEARDSAQEMTYEASWVISPYMALTVLTHSDNWDAIDDQDPEWIHTLPRDPWLGDAVTMAARAALFADVMEVVERRLGD